MSYGLFKRAGAMVCAVLLFAALPVLVACSQKNTPASPGSSAAAPSDVGEGSSAEFATGGWEIATDAVASQLTSEQQESFAQASEGYVGVGLTPVAALGTQVVAGSNTAYLCQGTTAAETPETSWYVAVVYETPHGALSLASVEAFDIADIETTEGLESNLAGGWQVVPNTSDAVVLPNDALAAWAAATEAYDGGVLAPVAVLGTQVVAGTNYLVLASSTDDAGDATLHVVTLHANLEGDGEIIDDYLFDLLAYV